MLYGNRCLFPFTDLQSYVKRFISHQVLTENTDSWFIISLVYMYFRPEASVYYKTVPQEMYNYGEMTGSVTRL